MKYRTADGDVLDDICFKQYGTEQVIVEVFEANPGLADLGPLFSSGILIDLPEISQPGIDVAVVRLWD